MIPSAGIEPAVGGSKPPALPLGDDGMKMRLRGTSHLLKQHRSNAADPHPFVSCPPQQGQDCNRAPIKLIRFRGLLLRLDGTEARDNNLSIRYVLTIPPISLGLVDLQLAQLDLGIEGLGVGVQSGGSLGTIGFEIKATMIIPRIIAVTLNPFDFRNSSI